MCVSGRRQCRAGDVFTLGQSGSDRQYRPVVIRYRAAKTLWLLNISAHPVMVPPMKRIALIFGITAGLALAGAAQAQCFADYKAKQDSPLRLHYGVIEVTGPCRPGPARKQVRTRLEQNGWTLLNVLGVFGPAGLEERRANAGAFYLRF